MKQLLTAITIVLFSCGQYSMENRKVANKQEKVQTEVSQLPKIGEKIYGDFNGDGQTDLARAIRTKLGHGNPIEYGTADEYEVQFSDKNTKSISAGCCNLQLINEGDLNNNGTDEISLFQAPMNGCTYSMTTYSFINGTWKQFIETFLIPTACESISESELQKKIFKENDTIFYYDIDLNDENRKWIKKKVTTK